MSQSWVYGEQFSYSPPVKYKGLINQGATCYLNSVLQVLFMTDDFREAVERYPGTEFIDNQLKSLFGRLKDGTTDTFDITKTLDIKRVYEQRDAAEYFEKILNLCSDESSQIFFGRQSHRTVCSACETQKDSEGRFWHLPLTLVESDGDFSVVNGIKDYFKSSKFSGDNQMYCDQCDAKRDATLDCVIKRHPEVLLLLLKRFELDYHSMTYFKVSCSVHIPHTVQIPENQTYELYAVVDHVGDLKHGHYTASIRSQEEDRWFKFDDARVTELDFQPFQSDNFKRSNSAYLLFYRRKSDDIRKASAPGGCSSSISVVKNQRQEADVANGGEHQDSGELEEVGKSIKLETQGRQEGGEDTQVEKRVKGDCKAAVEGNSGVETKKFLTKWDLLLNTTRDDVKAGGSVQNMLKQGSSSRYESYERHRVENKAVQRAEERKGKDEKHSQEVRALMRKPEADTDRRSSDDKDSVTHPVQGDSDSDRDSSSSSQTGQAEEEVGQTQAGAESEAAVGENQNSDKSGTCIVRIYEDEKRVTPSVTVRSTEKFDIKLKTLKATVLNRGGSLEENVGKGDNSVPVSGEAFQFPPNQEGQNKKINLDVRSLLANFSQDNMFEIRCQSPAPQDLVTVHETRM